jgi:hypothetical protein
MAQRILDRSDGSGMGENGAWQQERTFPWREQISLDFAYDDEDYTTDGRKPVRS